MIKTIIIIIIFIIVTHAHSWQVHDVGTAFVVKREKMASVAEMYDVGWEGKTKDKVDSPQVLFRHVFIFLKAFCVFLVYFMWESMGTVLAVPDWNTS